MEGRSERKGEVTKRVRFTLEESRRMNVAKLVCTREEYSMDERQGTRLVAMGKSGLIRYVSGCGRH